MICVKTRVSPQEFNMLEPDKKIICAGIGEMFREAFEHLELEGRIGMLLDNAPEKQRKGIRIAGRQWEIQSPSILKNLDLSGYFILLSTKYYDSLCGQINEMIGEKRIDAYIYPDIKLYESLLNRSLDRYQYVYSKRLGDCNEERIRELLRQRRDELQGKKDYTIIPKLNVIVTEKCSLRCRDCRALIPLVEHPADEPIELVKKEIDQILASVDRVVDIEPIGGEPFLYPDLAELLCFLCSKDKVDNVWITTNGTILPDADLTAALRHEKIYVEMSNYGHIEQMAKTVHYFEAHGIQFSVFPNQIWSDVGGTECRNRSLDALKKEYSNCNCQYVLKYVWDNKIWICPRAPRLSTLGVFESEHDYIDLEKEDRESLRDKLTGFFFQEYAEACNYCNQGDLDIDYLPAGIQTNGKVQPSNYTIVSCEEYMRLLDFWNAHNVEEL